MVHSIALSGRRGAGLFALIDDTDAPLVQGWRWYYRTSPGGTQAHVQGCLPGSKQWVYLHTLLTGWERVDHVDGDGLNCQRYNMREATPGQNMANSRKRAIASSRFKGVSWNQDRKRWDARIRVDRRNRFLGRFRDEVEAARAYDRASLESWGQDLQGRPYARTNVMLGLLPPL